MSNSKKGKTSKTTTRPKSRTGRKCKAFSEKEEKVCDLMFLAQQSLGQALEISPEAYYERAQQIDCFPALIPRQRKKFSQWHKRMVDEGIILKGQSNVCNPDHPMYKAVEQALEAVVRGRILQHLVEAREHGEKYALRQLSKLGGPFCPASFPKWKEAFMEQHDQHPEKDSALLEIVNDTTRNDMSQAQYRSLIRKEFVKAARRFAKEYPMLWGD
jgi:hypothetical protein